MREGDSSTTRRCGVRRVTVLGLVGTLVAVVLASSAAAAGAPQAGAADPPPYLADASDPAVTTLAGDLGISIREAQRRIGWQEPAVELAGELERALGDRYGDLWFDPADGGRIKVGIAGGANALAARLIARLIARRKLTAVTDLVAVRHGYAELKQAAAWLTAETARANPRAHNGLVKGLAVWRLPDKNAVELDLPRGQRLTTTQQATVAAARTSPRRQAHPRHLGRADTRPGLRLFGRGVRLRPAAARRGHDVPAQRQRRLRLPMHRRVQRQEHRRRQVVRHDRRPLRRPRPDLLRLPAPRRALPRPGAHAQPRQGRRRRLRHHHHRQRARLEPPAMGVCPPLGRHHLQPQLQHHRFRGQRPGPAGLCQRGHLGKRLRQRRDSGRGRPGPGRSLRQPGDSGAPIFSGGKARGLLVGAEGTDPGQPPTPPCQDRLYQGITEASQQLHVSVVHT